MVHESELVLEAAVTVYGEFPRDFPCAPDLQGVICAHRGLNRK